MVGRVRIRIEILALPGAYVSRLFKSMDRRLIQCSLRGVGNDQEVPVLYIDLDSREYRCTEGLLNLPELVAVEDIVVGYRDGIQVRLVDILLEGIQAEREGALADRGYRVNM